jgi:hypothetical protein
MDITEAAQIDFLIEAPKAILVRGLAPPEMARRSTVVNNSTSQKRERPAGQIESAVFIFFINTV